MYSELISSPVGDLFITVDDEGRLTELYTGRAVRGRVTDSSTYDGDAMRCVKRQIKEYFAGMRRTFDIPIAPWGSPFQMRVWAALSEIPFGEIRSYGQIAAALGAPQASRAVGRANATNPISIIVPCHRVIGASGALTGYGGGLPVKRWLLEFEGAIPAGQAALEL